MAVFPSNSKRGAWRDVGSREHIQSHPNGSVQPQGPEGLSEEKGETRPCWVGRGWVQDHPGTYNARGLSIPVPVTRGD